MSFSFTLGENLFAIVDQLDYLCIIESLIRIISHDKAICGSPIRKRHQVLLQMNLFDISNFFLRFWVDSLVVFELKLLILHMLAITDTCHVLSLTGAAWNGYWFCSTCIFRMFDHIRFELHKLSLLLFLLRIRQCPTLIMASSTFDAW